MRCKPRGSTRPERGRSRSRRLRTGGAALLTCVLALACSAAAIAAGSGPTLVKPANHGTVHANKVELVVKDASSLAKQYGVFVSISRSRKTKTGGVLKETGNVNKGGSFVKLKKWSGHPGFWIYKPAKYDFAGYWASTPGRYYWQAEHTDCEIKGCEAVSKIGSFKVTG
jgi:hypothetical protein